MRVGLMADTHDRLPAISALLGRLGEAGVGLVMHAGDYCAPFALAPFHEAQVALLGVFGRNDGDPEGLKASAAAGMGTELYESPHSFDVSGHRILLVHDIGEVNRHSVEAHRFVIHGCSHRHEARTRGDTVIVNPGEVCGWLYGAPSAAVLDLETGAVEFFSLGGDEWRF